MDEVKVGKRIVRGRQYPWGVLQGKYDESRQCFFTEVLMYISTIFRLAVTNLENFIVNSKITCSIVFKCTYSARGCFS